ncbi:hypothetical protein WAE61_13190 [Comamonadaceae bacterium PP-2]
MFNTIWNRISTTASSTRTGEPTQAQRLMENAERYAGRTPAYAYDLRRAAQAQLLLDSYIA